MFARKGYFAARVDDIVKLAKTSHGTFYLYFANKEELFGALAAEVTGEMQTLAESLGPLEPGPAGEAALCEWIGRFADLYERYGPVIRAWTEAEIGSHEFGRLGNDVLTHFTRVLTVRIAQVAPPDLDPTIAALALVAMFERLNYYALSSQVRVAARRHRRHARPRHAAGDVRAVTTRRPRTRRRARVPARRPALTRVPSRQLHPSRARSLRWRSPVRG